MNDYNNHLSWTWKRNLNDLTNYNKSTTTALKEEDIDADLTVKPSSDNFKRKRGLSANMMHASSVAGYSGDNSTLCPGSRYSGLTKKRSLRDLKNVSTHPLSHENNGISYSEDKLANDPSLPRVDLLNLEDLDLKDDYFSMASDIKLKNSYKPLYSRIDVNYTKDDSIRKEQLSKQLDGKEYELDSWPNEKTTTENDGSNINDNLTLFPNKRSRQKISSPNFLKLYAIENNSIKKNHLPQIAIDDQSLQNVNSHNLSQFNFDPKIKLAIMTKKKIWIDLCNGIERNDLYGDNCPWNLKFVPHENNSKLSCNDTSRKRSDTISTQEQNKSSLLRLNSNLRPWKFNSSSAAPVNETQLNLDQSLLTPCGKLSRGQDCADLQYVIKGWCDERFQ